MDRSIVLLVVLLCAMAWGADQESESAPDAVDGKQNMKLRTVYQSEAVFGARKIELRGTISETVESPVEIQLDRNTCILLPDGSTGECTMIAPRVLAGTLKPVTEAAIVAAIAKTSAVWDIVTEGPVFHARLAKTGDAYRLIVLDNQSNPARVITLERPAK